MTIEEAAKKLNVRISTVKQWCQKHYLRGLRSKNNEYVIPMSVKKPYTGSRSKGDAIYTSIVRGTLKGFDVTAALYCISESEFKKYIKQLKDAGVIDSYIDEDTNVEYLCKTLKSSDFAKLKRNRVKAFLNAVKPSGTVNIGVNVGTH